ncbi:VWA domain-containing protein [candidate division KSB1 bacterium]|nr:VWA domain-containing protein [candidate division KSB1 bacterium]
MRPSKRCRTSAKPRKMLTYFWYCTLLCILPLAQLHAQAGTFDINFLYTTIDTPFVYVGKTAEFPSPVISLIEVKDNNNQYVHDLADTVWLRPTDFAANGMLVDSIWQQVEEYHRDSTDNPYPPNRNVKDMRPRYEVIEIPDVEGYGLTVSFTMDYSGSMGDDIYIAQDAARIFVRKMSINDEAAIIKFNGKVQIFQDFTSDTTQLMEAISRPPDSQQFTALYDALYTSVYEVRSQIGRQIVVAYTDGNDNYSTHQRDEVIQLAMDHDIPIFLIGLGPSVDHAVLRPIAESTGGKYYEAPTPSELAALYEDVFSKVRGYYLLAHTTTDSVENGTWRTVDIVLQDSTHTGQGFGQYKVPLNLPDLTIQKTIRSDSFQVQGNDTLFYAIAGDTVDVELEINNQGVGPAQNIHIVDFATDSLDILDMRTAPISQNTDSTEWSIWWIDDGDTQSIRFTATVRGLMPMGETTVSSSARVDCVIDSDPSNNMGTAAITLLGLPDLISECLCPSEVASPGFPFPISAIIRNIGNAHIPSPFYVAYYVDSPDLEPVAVDTVASLAVGDSALVQKSITFSAPGTYTVIVVADYNGIITEGSETNNGDLTCQIEVGLDSLGVQISDFSYTEMIEDRQGDFPDRILTRVQVYDQNWIFVPNLASTTSWLLPADATETGPPVQDTWTALAESHRDDPSVPTDPDVSAGLHIREVQADAFSVVMLTDFSQSLASQSSAIQSGWDRFLNSFTRSDRGAVITGNTTSEILQSFTSDPALLDQAFNQAFDKTARPAKDAALTGVNLAAAESGRNGLIGMTGGDDTGSNLSRIQLAEQAMESGVPLYWIDLATSTFSDTLRLLCEETGGFYFATSNGWTIQTALDRITGLLRNYYVLSYATPDTVQNQSWRRLDVSLNAYTKSASDTGDYRAPLGSMDLRITKSAIGKNYVAFQNDSLWQVQAGDTVHYTLAIWNAGHQDCMNFEIHDVLPPNLDVISSNPTSSSISGDTVFWNIPSLARTHTTQIQYTCLVDTLNPDVQTFLINKAEIDCPSDTITQNNTASDTVLYASLQPVDLMVSKSAVGDSLATNSIWFVHPDGTADYTVTVVNQGQWDAWQVQMEDVLPRSAHVITPPPNLDPAFSDDTLRWTIPHIVSRGGSVQIQYTCQFDSSKLLPWSIPLINTATAIYPADSDPSNNSASDTMYSVGVGVPEPRIFLSHYEIAPFDTTQIHVYTPIDVDRWDLIFVFEDSSKVTDFADDFSSATTLIPDDTTHVHPAFDDTRQRMSKESETVTVILNTFRDWGTGIEVKATASTTFRIVSNDEFYLDRNIFKPDQETPIEMQFKLGYGRWSTLNIYDVSGALIRKLVAGNYDGGWNYEYWDGRDDKGRRVGSGVYVAILISGDFYQARKFILVR